MNDIKLLPLNWFSRGYPHVIVVQGICTNILHNVYIILAWRVCTSVGLSLFMISQFVALCFSFWGWLTCFISHVSSHSVFMSLAYCVHSGMPSCVQRCRSRILYIQACVQFANLVLCTFRQVFMCTCTSRHVPMCTMRSLHTLVSVWMVAIIHQFVIVWWETHSCNALTLVGSSVSWI